MWSNSTSSRLKKTTCVCGFGGGAEASLNRGFGITRIAKIDTFLMDKFTSELYVGKMEFKRYIHIPGTVNKDGEKC